MKHAIFDANGFPLAFYSADINDVIPSGTVEITDEQWQELLQYAGLRKWDGSQVVVFVPPPPAPAPAMLPTANERLDAGIAAALDIAVAVQTVMQATPNNFTNANFTTAMIQLDALTAAFVSMLQAQATPAGPP